MAKKPTKAVKVVTHNTVANRERKLERHAKKHPNDLQSIRMFNATRVRSKPVHKGNFPPAKMIVRDLSGFPLYDVMKNKARLVA